MPRLRYMWILAMKDLKLFFRDRMALMFFILFPLAFMTMFSFMGGETSDPRLYFHMATEEAPGTLSHQIIGSMETENASLLDPGAPVIVWEKDPDAAYQRVENEELSGYLLFPEDFTEKIYAGESSELEVIVNPSSVNTRAALNGMADAISAQIGSHYVIANSSLELMISNGIIDPTDTDAIMQTIQDLFTEQGAVNDTVSGIQVTIEKTGDMEAENGINWSLTGYLVMFVFFAASLGAESIVAERQNHTLERLLTGQVTRTEILGGIFTGSLIKGIIQVSLFWVFGILVFGADLGLAPGAVILLSFIVVLMSSAFSLMLATLVKTQRAAGSAGTLTALILAPLGGCWWPLFILPKWMQGLGKVTPHGWANTGFNKLMLFGAEFGDVVPEMLVLILFAIVFGTIAVWKFRTAAD